tara:strand:+ start:381 stop:575 length:195 start_codon:yes stop_codon:yes gene_type:complete
MGIERGNLIWIGLERIALAIEIRFRQRSKYLRTKKVNQICFVNKLFDLGIVFDNKDSFEISNIT